MERSDLEELLLTAERGDHGACRYCPSSPRNTQRSAWGVSCREHGIDWSLPNTRALSMMIVQDPANTTPAITGKLCVVCNSKNSSDGSAQHGLSLWTAAVALTPEHERPLRYVDSHYWANAAMHSDGETLEKTSKCCRSVLLEQIALLKPRVIIATGETAAASLHGIGLLRREWPEFNRRLELGAYTETVAMRDGHRVQVFCTYHQSRRSVNQTVARYRYSDTTERLLAKKREALADPAPVDAFLSRYPATGTEGKGMRVLLLHWLDIGEAIRKAHEEAS